jgi:anaerobic magnesium-protoporphyrin IX monomethyl ester cyclase
VEELCRLMIGNRFNLPWSVPYGTRWETLTPELLKLMKQAGCYRVSIGIETGSQRLQEKIRKHIPLDKLKKRLRECRSAGVEIMGNFMYGFPGETREELKATLDYALGLDLDYASFYVYTPYPGSALYEELLGKGIIRKEDHRQFDKFDYDNRLSEATPKELYWLVRKSLLAFYLRPRVIRSLLRNMRFPHFYSIVFKLLYYEFIFPHRTQKHAY